MSDKQLSDPTPQQLIDAAIPMLKEVEDSWIMRDVSKKRMAKAFRTALQSTDGLSIAAKIAPYYNQFEQFESADVTGMETKTTNSEDKK